MRDKLDASKEFDKRTLKTKVELDSEIHNSSIHSMVWEDTEASEGLKTPKELITADSDVVAIWDLKNQTVKSSIASSSLLSGSELAECTVVKRDPHHPNLLCIGIEKGFY